MSLQMDLYFLALTIWMEAQGEEFKGQLAVGWVIMNRKGQGSVCDTVFRRLQFSCWNSDAATRMRIDIAEDDEAWESCYKAACASYFELLCDPTDGATHYLNPGVLTKLPAWYKKSSVVAIIGEHEFLRLE